MTVAHPRYRADIDGLRALAVLFVVVYHAFPSVLPGGFVGVDIFFVISGYLISGLIYGELRHGSFDLWTFYVRRIRRIFPALIAVLASCYAAGYLLLQADEFQLLGKHIVASAAFVVNLIFWREAGYFDVAAELKPLLHIWSLGVEEQFYLLWPCFLIAAHRLRINFLFATAVVLAASFIFNLYLTPVAPIAAFYLPLTRMWELMIGAVAAYAVATKSTFGTSRSLDEVLSFGGLTLVAASVVLIDSNSQFPGWWAVLPTLGAVLFISAQPTALPNRVASSAPLVWIGLISYPLYLWHWPILVFLRIVEAGPPSWQLRIGAVALSVALAAATYYLIEHPIRFGPKRTFVIPGLCAAMVMVGVLGEITFLNKGLERREANKSLLMAQTRFGEDLNTRDRTYSNNGSCEALLGLQPLPYEFCFTASRKPKILLLGDSHAMSLNSAEYAGRTHIDLLTVASAGCLPFESRLNFGLLNPELARKNCGDISAHALEVLGRVPSIETVLLNARDAAYLLSKIPGPRFEIDKPYNWRADVDGKTYLDTQDAFVRDYSIFLHKLLALGKRVVLLIDVPRLAKSPFEAGINVRYCVAPRPLGRNPGCSVERRIIVSLEQNYRRAVEELARTHPKLLLFDMADVFCSDTLCSARDDNHLYYIDDNHLSISGSEKALNAIAGWLARHGHGHGH